MLALAPAQSRQQLPQSIESAGHIPPVNLHVGQGLLIVGLTIRSLPINKSRRGRKLALLPFQNQF
ncbi:MAG: hypothetical protein ACEQSC_01690 [Candidatus Nanopelagicaceae bacterium]